MNKTKRGYEAPTSELLVVRFEQNILNSVGANGVEKSTAKNAADFGFDDWDD